MINCLTHARTDGGVSRNSTEVRLLADSSLNLLVNATTTITTTTSRVVEEEN